MGKIFLKRKHFDEIISIEEGLLYSCGRTKNSKIVCSGAAVSRNHCTFNLNSVNGLTVIDLASSNGVYVNGDRIGSKVEHLLHNNDTIGIGCFNTDSTSENDFIYIVQRHPEEPQKPNRKRNSQTTNISIPAKISKSNNNADIIVIDDDDRVKAEVLVSSSTDPSPGSLSNHKNEEEMDLDEQKPRLIPHSIEKISTNYTINQPSRIHHERAATSTSLSNSTKSDEEDLRDILNKKKKKKEESATKSPDKNDLSFGNISSIEPDTSSSFKLEEDIYCPSKSDLNSILNDTNSKQDPKSRYSQIDIDVINLDEFVEEEEEDCFPISQLFEDPLDIKVKPEGVAQELVEEFSAESEKDLFYSQDDDCEIISSDDDNDDTNNPWYARLYRSQVENESQIKHEVPAVAEIDEVANIIDSNEEWFDVLGNVLDEDEMNLEQREVEKPPSPVSKKKSPDREKKKSTKSLSKKSDDERHRSRKSSKDREKKGKSESRSKSTESRSSKMMDSRKKSSETDEARTSDQDSSDLAKQKDSSRKISTDLSSGAGRLSTGGKLSTSKSKETKKILQIEAPHLPKNKRHSVSCTVTTTASTSTASERITISSKDFYPDANKSVNTEKSPSTLKLTAKEKKELADKKKIEEYRSLKEKTLARMKNKWAKNSLPIGKGTPSPISKEEKKLINQDRREKLRELAEKRKSLEQNLPEKRIAKPKIKTSTNSRNDLLAVDVKNSEKKKESESKKSKKSSTIDEKNKSKHSEKSTPMIESSSNNNNKKSSKSETQNNNKNPESLKLKEPLIKLFDCRKDLDLKKQKENKSPNEKKVDKKKSKKRVTFNDALNTVREYQIEPGMSLKKCVAKDATLPPIQIKPPPSPKREEFLLRIFNWNPLWLSEQKTFPFPPPIIQDDPRPLTTKYPSYENYYETMEPLLALEVWSGISREFDTPDPYMKRPILKTSIVTGSVSRVPIVQNSNIFVTTFMFEAVVSKETAMKQSYPVLGDLVMCEMAMNKNGKLIFHNIFVYVDSVHCTVIAPFTRYNKDLDRSVANPHTLLTYNMVTKSLETDCIAMQRLSRIKAVSYLRSNMRMIQALQYLPSSPLIKQILDPVHDDYQLPIVQNYEQYQLVTKDNLNKKQLEAVVRITETVVQRLPRICMIQGPPGTGKSKVIVNIITEILYGNNRYKNGKGPMRILVCAPSNAAIDEVVLRLLDIRKNIQNNEKFKLVRTGRPETMHDSVKPISLTELAKRDVASTTKVGINQSTESIEAEKSHLEARINALKMELDTHKQKKVDNNFHQQTIKAKYDAAILKYELLTNKKTPNNIDQRHMGKLLKASETTLLSGADIIACTLSSCYTNQMEALFSGKDQTISVCIVDEATQSTEAETLIPLMLGVKTMVLVGDPNQLPATVLSTQAKKLGLDKSLFSRLHGRFEQKPNNPLIFLDTQYRMSYPISYWPNRFFYNGALKNDAANLSLPFHNYRIINLESVQGADKYDVNSDEATFVTNLIYTIITFNNIEKNTKPLEIGIITPYNNQKKVIIGKLREKMMDFSEADRQKIKLEVNTVDSFQGQERDIIIMSCVRSNGIGFLSDRQRLNVALTRAKHSLFICGNFKTFERDQMWNALLMDARSRSVYNNISFRATLNEIRKHIMK